MYLVKYIYLEKGKMYCNWMDVVIGNEDTLQQQIEDHRLFRELFTKWPAVSFF